jgi:hypothetical protein
VVFESASLVLARYVDLRGCATFQSGGGLCGMICLSVTPNMIFAPTADNG